MTGRSREAIVVIRSKSQPYTIVESSKDSLPHNTWVFKSKDWALLLECASWILLAQIGSSRRHYSTDHLTQCKRRSSTSWVQGCSGHKRTHAYGVDQQQCFMQITPWWWWFQTFYFWYCTWFKVSSEIKIAFRWNKMNGPTIRTHENSLYISLSILPTIK